MLIMVSHSSAVQIVEFLCLCAKNTLCHNTWSPMLRCPHLEAGPVGHRLAMTMVGSMEPQPLSTITTPNISPLALGTTT